MHGCMAGIPVLEVVPVAYGTHNREDDGGGHTDSHTLCEGALFLVESKRKRILKCTIVHLGFNTRPLLLENKLGVFLQLSIQSEIVVANILILGPVTHEIREHACPFGNTSEAFTVDHLKDTVMLRCNILLAEEHVNTGVAATLVRPAIPHRWTHLEGHTDLGKAVGKTAFCIMALPVFADGILRLL